MSQQWDVLLSAVERMHLVELDATPRERLQAVESIRLAGILQRFMPDLHEQVKEGRMTLRQVRPVAFERFMRALFAAIEAD